MKNGVIEHFFIKNLLSDVSTRRFFYIYNNIQHPTINTINLTPIHLLRLIFKRMFNWKLFSFLQKKKTVVSEAEIFFTLEKKIQEPNKQQKNGVSNWTGSDVVGVCFRHNWNIVWIGNTVPVWTSPSRIPTKSHQKSLSGARKFPWSHQPDKCIFEKSRAE